MNTVNISINVQLSKIYIFLNEWTPNKTLHDIHFGPTQIPVDELTKKSSHNIC